MHVGWLVPSFLCRVIAQLSRGLQAEAHLARFSAVDVRPDTEEAEVRRLRSCTNWCRNVRRKFWWRYSVATELHYG